MNMNQVYRIKAKEEMNDEQKNQQMLQDGGFQLPLTFLCQDSPLGGNGLGVAAFGRPEGGAPMYVL